MGNGEKNHQDLSWTFWNRLLCIDLSYMFIIDQRPDLSLRSIDDFALLVLYPWALDFLCSEACLCEIWIFPEYKNVHFYKYRSGPGTQCINNERREAWGGSWWSLAVTLTRCWLKPLRNMIIRSQTYLTPGHLGQIFSHQLFPHKYEKNYGIYTATYRSPDSITA